MKQQTSASSFSADRPITGAEDDLLGRAGFARSLAHAVSGWRGNDSLVVALYGAWGIGKSSIKNMALEALKARDDSPYVVEYNPWQWSGRGQLAAGFFAEIGRVLGRGPNVAKARQRALAWKLYAARLGVPALLADGTRRAVVWILGIAGLLTVLSPAAATYLLQARTNAWVVVVGAALITLAATFGFARTIFDRIAAASSARAALLERKTLSEQKAELRSLLADLDRPVLVVVDDIDRLRANEIRRLFQLVKANADFPNLTYLLLFQRDIVEASFHEMGAGEGRDFLEKIVQVGFDVPPVEPARLHDALFAGLNRILEDQAVAKRFDQKHWQSVFLAMRGFFRNLRDVARFLGSLAFHVSLFRKDKSFEVNPVDLIAVEALRLFEPDAYARLRATKSMLTSAGSALGSRRDTKSDQAIVQSIFESASQGRASTVQGVLTELFPAVGALFGGSWYGDGFSAGWFRESRICHEDVFDRYFLLALPVDDISQGDLDYLIENAANRSLVSDRLKQYAQTREIETVLDRLEAYKETLPSESIVSFITAIMDAGDLLPRRPPGMFVIGADMHASRIIHWALKSLVDPAQRAAKFREACLLTTGIFLPMRKVVDQEAKDKIAQHPEWYFLSDEDIRVCKEALLERIRKRAQDGLEDLVFLPYVLFRWRDWSSSAEVTAWIEGLLKQKSGVMALLVRFLSQSTSAPISGGPVTVHHRISLKAMRELADPEVVEKALADVNLAELNESERVAVDAFKKARQREAKGLPEDDWAQDDDDEP